MDVKGAGVGALLAMATVPVARGDIVGEWTEIAPEVFEFRYEVTNLADLDQVRSALPNCGLNHCVPTTTADLLAYVANHGFPEVPPGPGAWMSPALYPQATAAISSFGAAMGTDPSDGTNRSQWVAALAGIPGFVDPLLPPSTFTVTAMFAKGEYRPRMYAAAKTAIFNNGLLSLCHGWYKPITCGPAKVDFRDGGHCLAVAEVSGYLHANQGSTFADYGAEVLLHDPAADEGTDGKGACGGALAPGGQSSAAKNAYALWLRDLYSPIHCIPLGKLDRLNICVDGVCDDSAYRLVDAYLMIATKSAYSFSADPDPIVAKLKPIQFVNASPQPAVQILGSVGGAAGAAVAAAIGADGDTLLMVAGNAVKVMDPLQGGVQPLPEGDYQLVAPSALAVGRNRSLYVVDQSEVTCVDLASSTPIQTASVTSPVVPTFVLVDDRADEVVVLSQPSQAVVRYPLGLDGRPEIIGLPTEAHLAPNSAVAVDPTDGRLWISNGAGLMHRVKANDGPAQVETFTLPAVQSGVGGFDVDDAGSLIVSVNGSLREYARQGAALVETATSPFKGLPGGPTVLVTHSRSNVDPAIHDGPGWNDVFPESFAPALAPCLGDLDSDGDVDAADLAQLLGAWGGAGLGHPADLDGDGDVGPVDLAQLLGAWGGCPAAPPAQTALSDECGTAPLVQEGSVDFDTLGSTTDGPALPQFCDEGFGLSLEGDVWALYLPSATGVATITTCGSAFDTRMAVYSGFCGALDLIACNDDSCGLQSTISLFVFAGEPVLVRVGGYGGAAGQGSLSITLP